jgi:hypothetical protein
MRRKTIPVEKLEAFVRNVLAEDVPEAGKFPNDWWYQKGRRLLAGELNILIQEHACPKKVKLVIE